MATVNDVALRAGVSVATVSRVLSGKGLVAATTRQRVLAAIRELDFSPNHTARALRLGRISAIALLVGDIEQSVYASLTRHLQAALAELGLDLLIYDLGHSNERLSKMVDRAIALRLSGLALASTDLMPLHVLKPLVQRARLSGLWVVSLRQQLHEHGIPSIVQNDRDAAARAVNYLLNSGRRSIAYLGRIEGSVMGTERFQGYRDALVTAGITLQSEWYGKLPTAIRRAMRR